MEITSKDNGRIKEAILLRDQKKKRKEEQLLFLEGLRLCCDAFYCGIQIEQLFTTEKGAKRLEQDCPLLLNQGVAHDMISEQVAEKLSDTKNDQGIFAICQQPIQKNLDEMAQDKGILLLSSLQDPGNVGTIIRTAEALGIGGMILSEDCPDIYSQKVLRGTMGGVFRLPIMRSSDLPATIMTLRQGGMKVYGAALEKESKSVCELSLKGCGVVIGNEGKGLSQEVKACCDGLVIIPITQNSESLNAGVAASLLAWEMVR